jgi:hypothetical protein
LKQLLLRRLIFSEESVLVGDHHDPTLGAVVHHLEFAEESAACQVAFVRLPALDGGRARKASLIPSARKKLKDWLLTKSPLWTVSMALGAFHRFRSSADFSFAASLKSAKPTRAVPRQVPAESLDGSLGNLLTCT